MFHTDLRGTPVLLPGFLTARARRSTVLSVALVATAVLLSACAGTPSASKPTPASPPAAVAPAPPSAVGTATSVSEVQVCAVCSGKGMPAKFEGTATVKSGVQVIEVALVNGTYAPNVITAQAGIPTQVVFTGKAKGCLAKPTFKSLGKSADLTATGMATIDLGSLKPGVYKFTCAMGMNAATITVQ